MEIISIVNRRGGVGKTATTHALGTGLQKFGYKVLFIDLDSQCNLTYDCGVSSSIGSYDVLLGEARIENAIVNNVLSASPKLACADTILNDVGKEYKLKEALQNVKYDYVVIDTPPSLNVLTVNALVASNKVIIPAQAEIHSMQGIGLINETIQPIIKYCNPNLKVDGILITRFNARTIIGNDMKNNIEELAKKINTKVYKIPIRECTAVKEAQARQSSIFDYKKDCNAYMDYMAFIDEFLRS